MTDTFRSIFGPRRCRESDGDPMLEPDTTYCPKCGMYPLGADEAHVCTRAYHDE